MSSTFIKVQSVAPSPREAFKAAALTSKNQTSNELSYTMASYDLHSLKEALELADNLSQTLPYSQPCGLFGCIRISNKPKKYLFFGWV